MATSPTVSTRYPDGHGKISPGTADVPLVFGISAYERFRPSTSNPGGLKEEVIECADPGLLDVDPKRGRMLRECAYEIAIPRSNWRVSGARGQAPGSTPGSKKTSRFDARVGAGPGPVPAVGQTYRKAGRPILTPSPRRERRLRSLPGMATPVRAGSKTTQSLARGLAIPLICSGVAQIVSAHGFRRA